jgi:nitrite reductase/ring-hydroxylating ferredoxin subunit
MPHIDLKLENVPEDKLVRFGHEGLGIVVIRRGASIHAYLDECPHAGWRISDGELRGDVVECLAHGWEFSVVTGSCLTVPDYQLTPVIVRRARGSFRLVWGTEAAAGGPNRGIAWSAAAVRAWAWLRTRRLMDYALAAVALTLCATALVVVAPAIRVGVRGPTQTRVRQGRAFSTTGLRGVYTRVYWELLDPETLVADRQAGGGRTLRSDLAQIHRVVRASFGPQARAARNGSHSGGCERAKSGACPGCRARALILPGSGAAAIGAGQAGPARPRT